MAAAEKFASWAAVEEVNDEHPIKYLTGLADESDFEDLSSANKRLVLNLAFRYVLVRGIHVEMSCK